ncbi:hypothetical protein V2G26_012441 [Clonostachys chloroleuca]
MQGPARARAVFPSVREWVGTEEARKAVHHAALCESQSLPPGSIQGSVAIMVYYASLALWVYGLLAYGRADGRSDRVHTVVAAEPAVYLGEPEETIRLRRFVERGGGRTCIRSSRGKGTMEQPPGLRLSSSNIQLPCSGSLSVLCRRIFGMQRWLI